MARQHLRLTAAGVRRLVTQPGMHPDGDGLYLQVERVVTDGELMAGTASWVWRYLVEVGPPKKTRNMGLGPVREVSLAEARLLAAEARKLRKSGIDPIKERRDRKLADAIRAAHQKTFRQVADEHYAAHHAEMDPKTQRLWTSRFEMYVYQPKSGWGIGGVQIAAITTRHILDVLEPLWDTIPETGRRLQGYIEAVLDRAISLGDRPGPNPARWAGHIEGLLTRLSTAKEQVRLANGTDEHHKAVHYTEAPSLLLDLQQLPSLSAKALQLVMMTGLRDKEARLAQRDEINFAERLYVVPASRMKFKRMGDHPVHLSDVAMALLMPLCEGLTGDERVFPGVEEGMMLKVLNRDLKRNDVTVHGCRTAITGWGRKHGIAEDVRELILGHQIGTKTKRAYDRETLLPERQQALDGWGEYLVRPIVGDNIIPICA